MAPGLLPRVRRVNIRYLVSFTMVRSIFFDDDDVMRFCGNCDRPFSWTTQKLYAAKAMADELGGLSDADRIESEGELRRRCRRHADT